MEIPSLSVSAYIAAKYSLQRTVAVGPESATGAPTRAPIWTFRTQQIPILRAFALVEVMKAFAREAISMYTDVDSLPDPRVRAGIACCVKAFLIQQGEANLSALLERCGAQGLFLHNQIASALVRFFLFFCALSVMTMGNFSSRCEEWSLPRAMHCRSVYASTLPTFSLIDQ